MAAQESAGRSPSTARNEIAVEDEVVDAVLSASRALVAVAARSLAEIGEDVTLAQYRLLVVLASRGPQRMVDLAESLAMLPSTATRMCDRLDAKGLIRRARPSNDRRSVRLTLSPAGRQVVADVTRRRREEIRRVLEKVATDARGDLIGSFRIFAAAAGEAGDEDWVWQIHE